MMGMGHEDHDQTTPLSRGLTFLKQDVAHSSRIREYESKAKDDQLRIAKLEGALRLAVQVLVGGDEAERVAVAEQLQKTLKAKRG